MSRSIAALDASLRLSCACGGVRVRFGRRLVDIADARSVTKKADAFGVVRLAPAHWPRATPGADRATSTAASAINAVMEDILPFAIGSSCLRKKQADRAVAPSARGCVMSESKHVKHRAGLNPLQLRSGIDEPLVPGAAQADQDRDVLLAVDREAHRRCIDAAAGLEFPALLQCFGVERHHLAR